MHASSFTIPYSAPFFDEAAQFIWQRYGHDACAWRQTLVLASNIRSSLSLREALIRHMPQPAFCPRIISFKNMPEYVGMQEEDEVLSSAQQIAIIFELLYAHSPLQRWEQAKSWQRQLEELSRSSHTFLSPDAFTSMLQPLWPGVWSDEIYKVYLQSSTMRLRQQSEAIWHGWKESPPQFPIIVVGSTGSTCVSGGWVDWVKQYEHGCIIERGSGHSTQAVRIVQIPHEYGAADWIASEVEQALQGPDNHLTIVSPLPFEALHQQLLARGVDVDRGDYANFRATPVGQLWSCLMRLVAAPSNLLMWECFKRLTLDPNALAEAEQLCRREKTIVASEHLHVWMFLESRPEAAPLHAWWSYLQELITRLKEIFQHPILEDLQSWPADITIPNVKNVAAGLLPHIDAWWPIPKYRFVRDEKPRVQWVGPWEARGLVSDRIWVCGLNEGVWPGFPQIEPWLAPHDRVDLGLPDVPHFEKLSHHDLMCTLGASPEVTWVTLEDQPPSRWIGGQIFQEIKSPSRAPALIVAPPVGMLQEPITHISVTEADRLMRDPYAYYVRAILKLEEMDVLPQNNQPERTTRDKGLLFHRVMQLCVTRQNDTWQALLDKECAVDFFWLHQLQACLPHIRWGSEVLCEMKYTLMLGDKKLTGRLDRVDIAPFLITNYKTGSLPSLEAIQKGWAPQLILETLLAAHHHNKDSGSSTLLSLKHEPDARIWQWTSESLAEAREAFVQWLDGIISFPASGSPGMHHIARKDSWMI